MTSRGSLTRSLVDDVTVTSLQVSTDFYYGRSWDVGVSSLLVWALGSAPSKDTFWTTDNSGVDSVALGGCPGDGPLNGCPADHSNASLVTHTIITALSTGPVGFSDALGQTNGTLIRATCASDGTLLKPSKPCSTVDRALGADWVGPMGDGQVYSTSTYAYRAPGTASGAEAAAEAAAPASPASPYNNSPARARAHYFLGFQLEAGWNVTADDFWPLITAPPAGGGGGGGALPRFARRVWSDWAPCGGVNHSSAEACGVQTFAAPPAPATLFTLPKMQNPKEEPLAPTLVTVTPVCGGGQDAGGWSLLGEYEKFAAVSETRFGALACVGDALVFAVRGFSAAEAVNVAVLTPDSAVLFLEVHVAPNASVTVTCNTPALCTY